ncbi:hypothetical protein WJ69_34410 [Burkholderia ubonensis]|nr:hypothetical protein WJ69_34410 [Burkholderia ubonensis]
MIEFAIAAPVVLALILIMMDLSLMLWAKMTLQYAVREGARYSVVDQGVIDNSPFCGGVIKKINDNSMGLAHILDATYEISVNNGVLRPIKIDPAASNCPSSMFGSRGDLVMLKLTAHWPLVTPMLAHLLHVPKSYQFDVVTTMQNEEH